MKYYSTLLLLLVAPSQGFLMPYKSLNSMASSLEGVAEDVDYDAPTERAMNVGNVVRSPKNMFMGFPVPPFLAKAMNLEDDESAGRHFEISNTMVEEMDEECYLGKNGDFDDCVDFDPLP
eukprot:scaffold248_cov111-Cylindrotheca_fusiformis.AAC.11